MAASDKTYRDQKTLDVVFGVSSLILLVTMIWMFVQDYNRPWKTEQRAFRDVEAALSTRQAIEALAFLDINRLNALKQTVKEERAGMSNNTDIYIKPQGSAGSLGSLEKVTLSRADAVKRLEQEVARLRPEKEKADARVGDIKSLIESRSSFVNIANEQRLTEEAKEYEKKVQEYRSEAVKAQAELDRVMADIKFYQRQKDEIERPLTQALTELKRLTDDLVRKARTAIAKTWGFGDWFRTLPIIDAFASPTKIHQFTLNELTIDYNFKNVTRFDRCMTCHQGIDRAAYTKDNLRALRSVPKDLRKNLDKVKKVLQDLRDEFAGKPDELRSIPDPASLSLTALSSSTLPDDRVNEFCAHPRLELFVGSGSKHPAEKFGCTSCHSGQGSATDFYWSSHTPNNPKQTKQWQEKHDWGSVHYWDFPMLPKRFIESSCLKCHHQVTDLITSYNKHEAPKLIRGYNLIREYGCYGCHEINGTRNGQPIGPDMRLEPYPAPELLPAADRLRVLGDKDNPPGKLRKVGPSLFRLAEKSNEEWTARWIKSPRSFRPDTRMPHFYGLANNNEEALRGTGQEKFPDAEAASIAHFLFAESKAYLDRIELVRNSLDAALKKDQGGDAKGKQAKGGKAPEVQPKDRTYYEQEIRRLTEQIANKTEFAKLDYFQQDEVKAALEQAKIDIALLEVDPPIRNKPRTAPKDLEAVVKGRDLFSQRGCLACHNHQGTTTPMSEEIAVKGDKGQIEKETRELPAIHSEAHFGPTLTEVAEKLGTKYADKDSARTWLFHWIKNPWSHSPRTKMPKTHLTDEEAANVAEWLLSQPMPRGEKARWDKVQVPAPELNTLKDLARVYLVRIVSRSEMEQFLGDQGLPKDRLKDLPADEKALGLRLQKAKAAGEDARKKELMWYVGRKAVSRYGCFGCHDIRGFENAKPIGTALDTWGKKDPARLAFENIHNFVSDHYEKVDDWDNPQKIADALKKAGKHGHGEPYEGFFWEALHHNTREGYLHQKIKEPRSYDYKRKYAWDDRARMPQFKFAHPRRLAPETKEQFDKRIAYQKALRNAASPAARERFIRLMGFDPTNRADRLLWQQRQQEGDAAFAARAVKEEADAREAVMTFVLGLVGEAMPSQYLSTPAKDRLAEVKGREVLDRFNCAGCHTVRPGSFDFRLTKDSRDTLAAAVKESEKGKSGDYNFPHHYVWEGRPPTSSEFLAAHGVRPTLTTEDEQPVLTLTLTEALSYKDAGGKMQNIRGSNFLNIPVTDLLHPSPAMLASPEALARGMREEGPYGGAFADLLVEYLVDWGRMEKARRARLGESWTNRYETPEGSKENGKARASAPPPLIHQGERTQPDWLYRFLRDPPRVRQLTVLRMPRFNLSEDDAKALVNYFAAVDRLNNPAIGLTYPYEDMPQRGDVADRYWEERTKDYIKRLTDQKRYDAEVAELRPVWEAMVKGREAEAKEAKEKAAEAKKWAAETKKRAEAEKDEAKKKPLAAAQKDAEERVKFWNEELARREALKQTNVGTLEEQWKGSGAYALAGYRVLTRFCSSCHEVGKSVPDEGQDRGPSLNISHERLRPGWAKLWIARPSRMVFYDTPMPPPFTNDEKNPNLTEYIIGPPIDQVIGVRDALLNYPQVEALPLNRAWLLWAGPAGKK
jgi:mono/diheme cytochrome c family protein